ncbi:MAG: glycosyltransferase [Thermodesulfobacteriota bacterium]
MNTPQQQLILLKHFFSGIDDHSLFSSDDPNLFQNLRRQVREAFFDLLLRHRPFLESETGLAWPYREFENRAAVMETAARQGETAFIQKQALLFLALLPFPGQWKWLIRAESAAGQDPEIQTLLASEQRKIAAKIQKKSQKKFKVRHFCQVLKRPRLPQEKGILRVFSLPYLFADLRLLKRLHQEYLIYVEPPWGVLARHTWLRAFAQTAGPCIIGTGGQEDAAFLNTQEGIITTRLAHGDFLEEVDVPLGHRKRFDLVFNATFDDMERKRHGFMLDLLVRPPLEHITALFIGRGNPGNVDACKQAVQDRGLSTRVTVLGNLMRKDVPEQLAACRIGVQTSLHENACRSIYECFRSDLPCLVTSSMAGFNFDLITPENGLVVSDGDLPGAILETLNRPDRFSPRRWFLENSGSRHSSRRLNREFKNLFSALGYSWREDIVPLGSSGATRYVNQRDYEAFLPEFRALLDILNPFLPIPLSLD